jgi:hypothetical protein
MALGIFAAYCDPQYDQTHSIQESFNETIFRTLEGHPHFEKFALFAIPFTSSIGRDTA